MVRLSGCGQSLWCQRRHPDLGAFPTRPGQRIRQDGRGIIRLPDFWARCILPYRVNRICRWPNSVRGLESTDRCVRGQVHAGTQSSRRGVRNPRLSGHPPMLPPARPWGVERTRRFWPNEGMQLDSAVNPRAIPIQLSSLPRNLGCAFCSPKVASFCGRERFPRLVGGTETVDDLASYLERGWH